MDLDAASSLALAVAVAALTAAAAAAGPAPPAAPAKPLKLAAEGATTAVAAAAEAAAATTTTTTAAAAGDAPKPKAGAAAPAPAATPAAASPSMPAASAAAATAGASTAEASASASANANGKHAEPPADTPAAAPADTPAAPPASAGAATAAAAAAARGPAVPVLHAVRLRPGTEVMTALGELVKERRLRAASVVTCVGSLVGAKLRLALAQPGNPGRPLHCQGAHEIVSLVGTLGPEGMHIHASLANAEGDVYGGHLLSGFVHTTVELVLCDAPDLLFRRTYDPETGFRELAVVSLGRS